MNALGFSSCQSVLTSGRVHSHGCYKFDNATLGLGPRDQTAHFPVFLHLRNTNLPGPSSVMRSESKHNKEDLSADTTKNVCGDDVHDRALVRQGHVSVSPFTLLTVALEPFASQLCLLSALTQGRFASSFCLRL